MAFEKLDQLVSSSPYSLGVHEKQHALLEAVREVTQFHYENCEPYRRLCVARQFDVEHLESLEDLPFLPVALFKSVLLMSVPREQLFREINSSATTSGNPSRVALDRSTSRRQTRCLTRVISDRLGNARKPFLVLDVPASVERSELVSARSSTIKSLLVCASSATTYLEESDGKLRADLDRLETDLRRAEQAREPVVIFGFTYILHAHVVRALMKRQRRFDLPHSQVIHIGGWKKLEDESVTPERLRGDCAEVFGVRPADVIDVYGFTEQSGLIYPTCEQGIRHVPAWGEVIARDLVTLEPKRDGQQGLLQFITPIQTSYPGHSVLTEDLGSVVLRDGCPCGRRGSGFVVQGRAPRAEVRGCGDIMAERFA